jgi:TolB protein
MKRVMKNLRSILLSKNYWKINVAAVLQCVLLIVLSIPGKSHATISIDINSPSMEKLRIAIPDFKNLTPLKGYPELATGLPEILSNDLDLSGYFVPMDKAAFIDKDGETLTPESINFKNWTVINADLLLKAGYTTIGVNNIEVEIRLYDTFLEKEVLGKKFLGKIDSTRPLMHRIANEIISAITGTKGMFLSRFVFVNNQTGNKEIYTCDFDGKNLEQITSYKSISLLPKWSPQGDKIAFNSYKDGALMLYLMDISSHSARRISSRNETGIGACWLPDGNKLVTSLSRSGNRDIFTIDLDGNVIQQLTNHWADDLSPSFSPDGSKMAFVSNRSGSPQIYVKDLQTGSEERITFDLKYCTSPVWSQSNRIAFVAINDDNFNIYLINPDGNNLKKLTEETGNNEDPCWSPDGRFLVFSSNRDGDGYHLYLMNANGQNQRRLTSLKGQDSAPSWSPF